MLVMFIVVVLYMQMIWFQYRHLLSWLKPVVKKLYMQFNALKSTIIRYGPKCTDLNIELHVDSVAIPYVNRVKCLGVYLMSAKSFKVCWHEPKKNF